MTYGVAYRFRLKSDTGLPLDLAEDMFVQIWTELTDDFKDNHGALGSVLHRTSPGQFHAYAQWPDVATRDAAADALPDTRIMALRMKWAELCEPSEVVFEGNVKRDRLAHT